jgi:peptidoglycan/LPS O-acetylase OafA/YrhL
VTKSSSGERLVYLDVWRIFAVSLVILSHLTVNPAIKAWFADYGLLWLGGFGYVGVLIFFFISGYVVARRAREEVAATGTFSIRQFYIRRALRIIPPLMFYVGTLLVLNAAGIIRFPLVAGIESVAYLCNNIRAQCEWYGGHTWSLAFEEQYYLLFPSVFCLVALGRRLRAIYLLVPIALALVPMIYPFGWIGRSGWVVIYLLFCSGYLLAMHDSLLQMIQRRAVVPFALAAVSIFVMPTVLFGLAVFDKRLNILYVIAIPVMVLTSERCRVLWTSRVVSSISRYGAATYSLYLWQQLATSELFSGSAPIFEVMAVGACVVMAGISYKYAETPIIRLASKFTGFRRARLTT